jgi:hypothetical protein
MSLYVIPEYTFLLTSTCFITSTTYLVLSATFYLYITILNNEMIPGSLSLLQYERPNSPQSTTVKLHVPKSPCTTPKPATVEDVTGFESEDEELEEAAKWRIDRLQSPEEDREYFVDYCKQICSFMFFVTGRLDHQSLHDCFPEGIYPTLREMIRIVGVVGEIEDRSVNDLGIQMVM